jgi:hypothetical protein
VLPPPAGLDPLRRPKANPTSDGSMFSVNEADMLAEDEWREVEFFPPSALPPLFIISLIIYLLPASIKNTD